MTSPVIPFSPHDPGAQPDGPSSSPKIAADDPRIPGRLSDLQAAYQEIHDTRMVGLPVCNPRLTVEAVGFRPWEDGLLGALVTPWFLDLAVIPIAASAWSELEQGAVISRALPAGTVQWTVERETAFGPLMIVDLFSPLGFVADQAHARAIAQAAVTHAVTPASAMAADSDRPVSGPQAGGGLLDRRTLLRVFGDDA